MHLKAQSNLLQRSEDEYTAELYFTSENLQWQLLLPPSWEWMLQAHLMT